MFNAREDLLAAKNKIKNAINHEIKTLEKNHGLTIAEIEVVVVNTTHSESKCRESQIMDIVFNVEF